MKAIRILVGAAMLPVMLRQSRSPALVNTCLITDSVPRMVDFYAHLLGQPTQRVGDVYAEFHTPAAVLAIFSAAAQEAYIPGSARSGPNASVILEFRVDNV